MAASHHLTGQSFFSGECRSGAYEIQLFIDHTRRGTLTKLANGKKCESVQELGLTCSPCSPCGCRFCGPPRYRPGMAASHHLTGQSFFSGECRSGAYEIQLFIDHTRRGTLTKLANGKKCESVQELGLTCSFSCLCHFHDHFIPFHFLACHFKSLLFRFKSCRLILFHFISFDFSSICFIPHFSHFISFHFISFHYAIINFIHSFIVQYFFFAR